MKTIVFPRTSKTNFALDKLTKQVAFIDETAQSRKLFSLMVSSTPRYKLLVSCEHVSHLTLVHSNSHPAIIVLSYEANVPDSSIRDARELKTTFPGSRILVVGESISRNLSVEMFKEGVSVHIHGSSNWQRVISAMDDILDGRFPMSEQLANHLIDVIKNHN